MTTSPGRPIQVSGGFNQQTGAMISLTIGVETHILDAGAALQIVLAIIQHLVEARAIAASYELLLPVLGEAEALAAIQKHQQTKATHERAQKSGLLVPRKGN